MLIGHPHSLLLFGTRKKGVGCGSLLAAETRYPYEVQGAQLWPAAPVMLSIIMVYYLQQLSNLRKNLLDLFASAWYHCLSRSVRCAQQA